MSKKDLKGSYILPSGKKMRVGISVDVHGRDWNAVYFDGTGSLTLSRAFIEKWCAPI